MTKLSLDSGNMGNKAVIKHPNLIGVAFLNTKF